jgi:hypothetical protein
VKGRDPGDEIFQSSESRIKPLNLWGFNRILHSSLNEVVEVADCSYAVMPQLQFGTVLV